MGLFTEIKKFKEKSKEVRVLVLGLDNAGKTTVTNNLLLISGQKGLNFNELAPTFGFSIRNLVYNELSVIVWDVGGQVSLRPYWQNYFESTDALIWVVDSCDISRLGECREQLFALLKEEQLIGASLLILANKMDVENSLNSEEIEEILSLDSIKSHNWRLWKCSGLSGQNIPEAFDWVFGEIKGRVLGEI